MKTITVHHRDTTTGALTPVAEVETDIVDTADALEFAWVRTQNIDGSWSQGPYIGDMLNHDHHPAVTRLAPLPEHLGRVYGLRSSMVGDVFQIGAERWEVGSVGFDKLT